MHTQIFNELLKLGVETGASDCIIKTNKVGFLRISGRLKPVDMEPIPRHIIQAFVDEYVPFVFKPQWDTDGQIDFAYTAENIGRFRVNAFQQRGSISVVLRHIKSHIPTFSDLNLQPERLVKLAQVKSEQDAPTIGLLLCKTQNRVVAEYALRDVNKPIGVAEYQLIESLPAELQTSLPSIEQIERELEGL